MDRYGEPIYDDSFLFCLNPHHEHIQFYIPACTAGSSWEILLDTRDAACTEKRSIKPGEAYDMLEHSAVLFREVLEKPVEVANGSQTVELNHRVQAEEPQPMRP